MSLPEQSLLTSVQRKNVDVFDRDAERNKGYLYTKNLRLNCRLATQHSTDAILATERLCNRSVVGVGCGDGFYTIRSGTLPDQNQWSALSLRVTPSRSRIQ